MPGECHLRKLKKRETAPPSAHECATGGFYFFIVPSLIDMMDDIPGIISGRTVVNDGAGSHEKGAL